MNTNLSIRDGNRNDLYFNKSNAIINCNRYWKIMEDKLFDCFHYIASRELSVIEKQENIEKKDITQRVFKTTINDLINLGGLEAKDFEYIKKVMLSLLDIKIQIDVVKENETVFRGAFPLLQKVYIYSDGKVKISKYSTVEFKFTDDVFELLKDPRYKNYQYTRLNMMVLSRIKGSYWYAIYQLIKENERRNTKTRRVSLDELRKLTRTEDKYPKFANFREKVLEPAKKEINWKDENGDPITDIKISYEPKTIWWWRKINCIEFTITKNPNFKNKMFETGKLKEKREAIEEEIEREQKQEIYNNILDDIIIETADKYGETSEEEKIWRAFFEIWEGRPRQEKEKEAKEEFYKFMDENPDKLEFIKEKAFLYIEHINEQIKDPKFDKKFILMLWNWIKGARYNDYIPQAKEKKERKFYTGNEEDEKPLIETPLF